MTNLPTYNTSFGMPDIERYLHEKAVNNITNSDNTTRSYRTKLSQFLEFSGGVLSADTARSYRDKLSGSRDSDQVKAYLYVLSNFFQFLGGSSGGPNPFYDLSRAYRHDKREASLKKAKRDDRVLTDDDVAALVRRASSMSHGFSGVEYYLAYRNWFMIKMLSDFGMRIDALVSIDLEHIDQKQRKCQIVASKNQVPYPIPIGDVIYHIQAYLNVRSMYMSQHIVDSEALFLSRSGRRLSAESARKAINVITESVGLYERQRSTHQLRHYRATRYYRDGMAPQLISTIMGMSETTLRTTYLHLTDNDTIKEYEEWVQNRKVAGDGHVCPRCGYREGDSGEEEEKQSTGHRPALTVV